MQVTWSNATDVLGRPIDRPKPLTIYRPEGLEQPCPYRPDLQGALFQSVLCLLRRPVRPPSRLDTQYGIFEKNFRLSYIECWSIGFQRPIHVEALLDVSYVGAEGHRLTRRADLTFLDTEGK